MAVPGTTCDQCGKWTIKEEGRALVSDEVRGDDNPEGKLYFCVKCWKDMATGR